MAGMQGGSGGGSVAAVASAAAAAADSTAADPVLAETIAGLQRLLTGRHLATLRRWLDVLTKVHGLQSGRLTDSCPAVWRPKKRSSPCFLVSGRPRGVVDHAGLILPCFLADE